MTSTVSIQGCLLGLQDHLGLVRVGLGFSRGYSRPYSLDEDILNRVILQSSL